MRSLLDHDSAREESAARLGYLITNLLSAALVIAALAWFFGIYKP